MAPTLRKIAFLLWLTAFPATVPEAKPIRERVLGPGVVHQTFQTPGPNVVQAVRLDRDRREYSLELGFPFGRRNYPEKEILPNIVQTAERNGRTVLAAVNGAYFGEGLAVDGPLASEGELIQVSADRRSAFFWGRAGECAVIEMKGRSSGYVELPSGKRLPVHQLNSVRHRNSTVLYTPLWGRETATTERGTEVILRTASFPLRTAKRTSAVVSDVRTGAGSVGNPIPWDGMVLSGREEAGERLGALLHVGDRVVIRWSMGITELLDADLLLGAAGRILVDGRPDVGNWNLYSDHFAESRHPRTAVGWDDDYLWLFVCDGRQSGRSVGMTFREMADFFRDELGAESALNLDGGGSTTMTLGAEVVNKPSDFGGAPRRIANGLLLVKRRADLPSAFEDDFSDLRRRRNWTDKFTYNPVSFPSPPLGGNETGVIEVRDPAGGYETVSFGEWNYRNYSVEADVFCRYRPEVDGSERYGLFARDSGGADFESSGPRSGDCYALYYDSKSGRFHAVSIQNGVETDFTGPDPPTAPLTKWRRLRIECRDEKVRYLVDGREVASVADASHTCGPCGIGFHEYLDHKPDMTATYADNFRFEPFKEE